MSDKEYEDTTMNELLLEEIKLRKKINQRRYEKLSQRSYILRKAKKEGTLSKPVQV